MDVCFSEAVYLNCSGVVWGKWLLRLLVSCTVRAFSCFMDLQGTVTEDVMFMPHQYSIMVESCNPTPHPPSSLFSSLPLSLNVTWGCGCKVQFYVFLDYKEEIYCNYKYACSLCFSLLIHCYVCNTVQCLSAICIPFWCFSVTRHSWALLRTPPLDFPYLLLSHLFSTLSNPLIHSPCLNTGDWLSLLSSHFNSYGILTSLSFIFCFLTFFCKPKHLILPHFFCIDFVYLLLQPTFSQSRQTVLCLIIKA